MPRRILAAVLGLWGLSCSSSPLYELNYARAPDRAIGSAPVEILERRVRIDIEPMSGQTTVRVYQATAINTAAGLEEGNIRFPIWGDNKLSNFKAHVVTPDGRKHEISRGDLERVPVIERFAGKTRKYMYIRALPRVEPGSVVEVSSVSLLAYLLLNDERLFEERYPLKKVELIVTTPRYLGLDFDVHGLTTQKDLIDRRSVFRFSGQDLGGRRGMESYSALPSRRAAYARWRIVDTERPMYPKSYNRTWKDSLDGYADTLSRDLKGFKQLPDLSSDLAEAVREAVRWVKSEVRVMDDSRARAYGSMSSAELLRRGFATRDQLSRLVWAVLYQKGHRPPLLFAPDAYQVDSTEAFPTPRASAHDLILVIDEEKNAFFDPHCIGCAVGQLARVHHGRSGVLLRFSADSTKPVFEPSVFQTPIVAYSQGSTERWLDIYQQGGRFRVKEMGLELRGADAAGLRRTLELRPTIGVRLEKLLRRRFFDEAWGGRVHMDANEPGQLRVWLSEGELMAPLISQSGGYTAVTWADAFPVPWFEGFGPERRTPVVFDEDRGFKHSLTLRLEPGAQAVGRVETASVASPWAKYATEATTNAEGLRASESLSILVPEISVQDYPAWTGFLTQMHALRRRAFVVKRTRPRQRPTGETAL